MDKQKHSIELTCLQDLEDPQVELLLLRSCLGVCKLNHLLRTIPPGSVDSELLWFDDNLRCLFVMLLVPIRPGFRLLCLVLLVAELLQRPFGCCVRSSTFAPSFCLPFQGALLLCPPFQMKSLPLPICLLCFLVLLCQRCISFISIFVSLSSCSLCDQASISAISSHACASAWLIPSVSLGLTMSRQEFVCSLWYWLGIPLFVSTDSIRCSCGSVVGCGHGPMRIR